MPFITLTALIFILSTAWSASSPRLLDVGALRWRCQNSNRSIFIPCRVPGYIIDDLIDHGIIGEPLYGTNEVLDRWVAFDTWTYSTTLEDLPHLVAGRELILLFEGLDTVADVYLDSQLILSARSFHRPHLASVLSPCNSTHHDGPCSLEIILQPALNYSRHQAEGHPYPIPSNTASGAFPHFQFLRKPASDFGWDWGPAISPAGIHSSIMLINLQEPMLRGATVQQNLVLSKNVSVERAALMIEVELWVPSSVKISGLISVDVVGPSSMGKVGGNTTMAIFSLPPSLPPKDCLDDCLLESLQRFVPVKVEIQPEYVELWWPVGYGAQPLYHVIIKYCQEGKECDQEIERRVGFRTIDLVTDPLEDQEGETFFFRANGADIFAKGANMIPLEVIHTRASLRGLEHLVEAALDQNMNMIRVWGGGRYQLDAFYDLCDERGLLVWQEVMAACNPYPTTEASRIPYELLREVKHQIRRLSTHPSIVLWGGNNEVEASFDWYEETRATPRPFAASYQSLFVEGLAAVFRQLDPGRRYLDGSPSNMHHKGESTMKRWGDPQSPLFGDIHFYDYASDCLDVKTYPKARFISEFGFQSMPSFESLRTFASDVDLNEGPFGSFMRSRQRHEDGDEQMMAQLQRHFHLPDSFNGLEGLLKWIYLTQVQQALCYQTALSYWRRLSGSPSRTGGILYWQLNDVWPGQSWSSLNYSPKGGMPRRKPLHYAVKRAFAPLALTTELDQDDLSVFVSSDLSHPIHVQLHIRLVRLSVQSCNEAGKSSSMSLSGLVAELDVPPRTHGLLAVKTWLSDLFKNDDPTLPACTPYSCYVNITARYYNIALISGSNIQRSLLSQLEETMETQVFLVEFKNLDLPPSVVDLHSFERQSKDKVCFQASANISASLLIVLEHNEHLEGAFSDNLFHLEPCGLRSICFVGRNKRGELDEEALKASITANHVRGALD